MPATVTERSTESRAAMLLRVVSECCFFKDSVKYNKKDLFIVVRTHSPFVKRSVLIPEHRSRGDGAWHLSKSTALLEQKPTKNTQFKRTALQLRPLVQF